MRIILTIIALFTLAQPALASTQHEDIAITVNGMVCDFCAQSVWKVFEDYEQVSTVDVDLDTGIVLVHLKPGQALDDAALEKAITYAGYDLVKTERVTADHL